ncbi:unnamed protein product [Agarophyton chilense]
MALDPHTVHHLASSFAVPPHVDLHSLQLLLSDAATAVSDTAAAAVETTTEAKKSGWWDSLVNFVENAIVSLHGRLSAAGVPGAYGVSIIVFTVIIKAITFPLNFRQMESTMKMQAVAPRLKKIQADYKDNPQVMNQMTAQMYKDEGINPLAGCLPVIVQIPVWIALYRSVLNLAADNLLNESFLWLPSLQGPVSKTGQGLNTWLFPLQDGAPPIGWHDASCYLVLPVILVATQFFSQRVMSPPSQDSGQQQANAILKFMPFLIGWFALNVPSGLGVYWVTNNLLSTAQTLFIRSRIPSLANPTIASSDSSSASESTALPSSQLDAVDGFRSNGTDDASKKATKSKKRRKRR